MARARPGLARAITDILEAKGTAGKRLSFRQAERLTGLAPATVSELAKGNARTPETLRRFAVGMGEDVTRLLLLAGFVPEDASDSGPARSAAAGQATPARDGNPPDPEVHGWLERIGRAITMLPPGTERDLWIQGLRRDAELLEFALLRLSGACPDLERKPGRE